MNVMIMVAIKTMVARNPSMIVMTMISVLTIVAIHLLAVYILNMTVMIIMPALPKHVLEENVIMNELTVTITMLVLMTAANQILVVKALHMIVTNTTLVLRTTAPKKLDVYTMMLTVTITMLVPLIPVAVKMGV